MNDIDSLRTLLSGRAFIPDEPGFAGSHRGFNLAETHRPDLVVEATCPADIAAAIAYACAHDLPARVQATGHGVGLPLERGVLISTARMADMRIDADTHTVTASAGARWQDIIPAASDCGLSTLCGSSPDVGVVGYSLGGGMSPMGRTFGFAADHVRRLRMLDADGDLHTIDTDSEPDLFWALRGGKPSVGIVTELEIGLVDAPHYYGGAIFYPGADAAELLTTFSDWAPTLPESVSTSIALLRLPDVAEVPEPLRGRLSVHLRYVHIGDSEVGEALLAPMRAAAAPIIDLVADSPASAIGSVHQDPTEPMPARDDSVRLSGFPRAAAAALLEVAGPDVDVPLIIAEIRLMEGRSPDPSRTNRR